MALPRRPPLAAFFFLLLLLALLIPATASPVRAADPPVYLALGDSLAYGIGASTQAKGYVALTADALRRTDPYRGGLDLVNLARPGATSTDLLAPGDQLDRSLQEIARRAATPGAAVQIISVDMGANDLLTLAQADSPCLAAPAGDACTQRLSRVLGTLQTNLHTALQKLRQAAPQARICLLDLYNPYSGTGSSIEPIADVGVQQFNGVIRAVAADPALGAKLVSVFQLFEGRAHQWIAVDGIHPNDTGHAVIAELLLAGIEDRAPAVPAAILNRPTDPVGLGAAPSSNSGSGVSALVLIIALAGAFLAGLALSSVYFLARGRR